MPLTSFKLKNEYLSLNIQKPGEVYRGSRFDWTGQIIQVTYLKEHTFCTAESLNKSLINKLGRGFYNEFGIEQPVGYQDCKAGGKFHKIGVGMLTKKSDEPYNFFENYHVVPYTFSYRVNDKSAEFVCKASNIKGYSFQLNKQIKIKENTFTIKYTLKNNGKKKITTNEYVHNFIAINRKPVNSCYRLYFPFKIIPQKIEEFINPSNVVKISGCSITWGSIPGKQFFLGNINSGYNNYGKWTLIHSKEKLGIQESTDFKIQKINVWGTAHVISPEIFFEINVAPGKSITWSRTYTMFSTEKSTLKSYRLL